MNIEQHATRDEWLAARTVNHGIGASTATAILGLSSYRGPWAVWAERTRGGSVEPNPAIIRGQVLEPIVGRVWASLQGEPIALYDNAIARHPEHPWFYFSPDGIRQSKDGPIPVEIKTSRWDKSWPSTPVIDPRTPELRRDYVWQPIVQACVIGAPRAELLGCLFDHDTCSLLDSLCWNAWERGDVAGAVPVLEDIVRMRGDFRLHTIHVPDGVRERMVVRLGDWRDRHLVNGEEPPYDGSSQYIDDATTSRGNERDELPPGTPDVDAAVRAWLEAKGKGKAQEEAARNVVINLLRDVPGMAWPDRSVQWQAGGGAEKVVSLSKIDKSHPEIAATLRREGLTMTTKRHRHPVARGEWG